MSDPTERDAPRREGGETSGAATPPRIPDHEMLRRIGRGSYGEVWLARSVTGAYRAVKVVARERFASEVPYRREFNGVRKFEPISRACEHTVAVLHVGRNDEAGFFYYVMELADDLAGEAEWDPHTYVPRTLNAELRYHRQLPAEACARIGLALTQALAHVHRHGLVHRDVKPSSVVFVGGRPKLADIGLVTDTQEGVSFVGTEGYVPPEGPGAPGADLFALGRLLYQISSGHPPQDYPEIPTDLRDRPDAPTFARLNEVIVRACEPEQHKRYRSAEEMGRDLDRVWAGPAGAGGSKTGWPPWKWVAVVAALVALFALVLGSLWRPWEDPARRPASPVPELVTTPTNAAEVRREPRLVLVGEFSYPLVDTWEKARVGCWNGDRRPELFVTSNGRLRVFSARGTLVGGEWKPPEADAADVCLHGLVDANGDGFVEPVVGWGVGQESLFLSALNASLQESRRFTNRGTYFVQPDNRPTRSSLTAQGLVDFEGDGRRELLASIHTGMAMKPRGLCCYSWDTQELLWFFPTGPTVQETACLDLNQDGILDVLIGTAAPANARASTAGLDDTRTWVYALSGKATNAAAPTLLWSVSLWDYFSQTRLLPDPTTDAFYVWSSYSGEDLRDQKGAPRQGEIVRLDAAGNVPDRYPFAEYLSACFLVESPTNRLLRLAAIDRAGLVYLLASDLTLLDRRPLFQPRRGRVGIPSSAACDLEGDRRKEQVLLYAEEEHISGDNPGTKEGLPVVRYNHNVSLVILDAELRPVARHPLAETLETSAGFSVWAGQLEPGQPNRILVFGDKVRVFEFVPGAAQPKP